MLCFSRSRAMLIVGLFTFCMLPATFSAGAQTAALKLDEKPAGPGEWGFRPAAGAEVQLTPPGFSWRPQKGLVSWEIECARGNDFARLEYRATVAGYNVHCPPKTFAPGDYVWRYRGVDGKGVKTNWSAPRTFTVAREAKKMPLPPRDELLARIPQTHPRLFVRPENVEGLRQLAKGELKPQFDALVKSCEQLLKKPPPTKEPQKYPTGMKSGSDPWRKIWWDNRTYTIRALDSAARLAFTRLLGGKEEYGQLAKRILLDCAQWDPKGATGYRYNDEAGMPYNYYFSRTYTFLHDLLSAEERATCRRVMKIRGDEMYRHLYPRHLWGPYGSHQNRAWHWLGEIGIAFHGEVEGAEDWTWFAANVFRNVYPVWCDDDGGWHEGSSYWSSYQARFTWWADVMREALGLDAYDKPYYSQVGYYAMYLLPPNKTGGGFGDLTAGRTPRHNQSLMSVFAAQSGNPHWQWYVEQLGGARQADGYIGFVRGALPKVEAQAPADLPASRVFRGTGQAFLNTSLIDMRDGVQVAFKSSPFGTQSHGYEANNSFLLWAYGQRLLIRSGYRDSYGSEHHKKWMWSTRSVNNITVNGGDQGYRTASARGEIVAFETTPAMDLVVGEAAGAYDPAVLDRFTRAIIFIKPELIVVYDRLEAKEPATFEYWLHAINKFDVKNQREIQVENKGVVCDVDFLAPAALTFKQTDQYDPNPRERVKLREWHLTASAPQKTKRLEFVTLYRPRRAQDALPRAAELTPLNGGYALKVKLSDGEFVALLPFGEPTHLSAHGLRTSGELVAQLRKPGAAPQTFRARQ